jgi:hypothetical protein
MKKQKDVTVKFSSPIRYKSNLCLLILFLILWPPIGFLMILKNAYFIQGTSSFNLHYHGSWDWLYFWGIVFFPIAFVLLVLKGVDIVQRHKALSSITM